MFNFSSMGEDVLWRYKSDVVTLVSQVVECIEAISEKYGVPYIDVLTDFSNVYNGVSSDSQEELLSTLKKGLHMSEEEVQELSNKIKNDTKVGVLKNDE